MNAVNTTVCVKIGNVILFTFLPCYSVQISISIYIEKLLFCGIRIVYKMSSKINLDLFTCKELKLMVFIFSVSSSQVDRNGETRLTDFRKKYKKL